MSKFEIFLRAVNANNLELVSNLYRSDFKDEVCTKSFSGYRPIHFASQSGFVRIVEFLLQKGCDKEAVTELRTRAIHCAATKGHCEVIRLLVNHKCNIEAAGLKGYRAIHFAIQNGQINAVKELLDHHCDIEAEDNKGRRPIHLAVRNGNLQLCRLLIKYKCDIEAEDNAGLRPVHMAATRGRTEILKELMLNRCDCKAVTKFLATPLDAAKYADMPDCVVMLERYNRELSSTSQESEKMDVKTLRRNFEKRSVTTEDEVEKKEHTMCSVCVSTVKDCILSCGHRFCLKCSEKMEVCRICSKKVTKRRRSSCFNIMID